MRIWLEIHCDIGIWHNNRCANNDHEYGQSLAPNVKSAYHHASRYARVSGWKQNRTKTQWYCPSCLTKFDTKQLAKLARDG